jgi:hypothetical protein
MIGIVAHDAGGAEVLSSYVSLQRLSCNYCLAGPAINVFERKLREVDIRSVDAVVEESSWILCGTSWQSDLEWRAIKKARMLGKRSVAFLDHWSNYLERFVRANELCLPDEIWVGDHYAKSIASSVFPDSVIRLVNNPFFVELKNTIDARPMPEISSDSGLHILFVSEPLREHGLKEFGNERHWGYTEEEGLRYFLSSLSIFNQPISRICIRPHPSEPLDKYDWVKQEYALPIETGGRKPLLDEVAECNVVVGFQSMALVVGLAVGKRVISCIPTGGLASSLPQTEIESLQALIQQLSHPAARS